MKTKLIPYLVPLSFLGLLNAQESVAAAQSVGEVLAAQIASGVDPMGRGISVLAADRILGQNASVAARDFLSRIGDRPSLLMKALRGKATPVLSDLGISNFEVQRWFHETTSQNVRTRVAGLFDGADAVSRIMTLITNKYAGSFKAYLRGERIKAGTTAYRRARLGYSMGLQGIYPDLLRLRITEVERVADVIATAGGE